jgi:hypothetical protein
MIISYFQIFLISFVFALVVGSGFYGFGIDFYGAYYKSNLAWGDFRDRLGWMLSTLTVYRVHVGVYLASFMLSITTGLLLLKTVHRYFYRKYYWLFFLMYLILLHTWPIIMSTSNAMRQGFSMSFLFLAIYFLLSKKYVWYLVSIGLVVMTHKSGLLLALLLVGINIYSNQIQERFNSPRKRRNLLIAAGFLLSIIIHILLPVVFNNHGSSRIISGDYRYPFLIINIMYILIYIKYLFIKSDQIDIFLLICSFVFPVFLFHDFNWEYERLNMMILILYMISCTKIFVDRDKKYALLIAVILLLFMTIFAGMYSVGLK